MLATPKLVIPEEAGATVTGLDIAWVRAGRVFNNAAVDSQNAITTIPQVGWVAVACEIVHIGAH